MPTQRFQPLLQAAVQRGLSSSLWVQEQELGHGLDEHLLPQTDVTRQLSANDTWVHAVAGDITSSQSLGELMCEEHVAEFAVTVGPEELPAEAAGAQMLVLRQSLKVNVPPAVSHR